MEKNIENIKFGKRIAQLRHEKHISQEALSFASNLNRTYIGDIERGEKTPSLLTIIKLAKGLNITKTLLMNYE